MRPPTHESSRGHRDLNFYSTYKILKSGEGFVKNGDPVLLNDLVSSRKNDILIKKTKKNLRIQIECDPDRLIYVTRGSKRMTSLTHLAGLKIDVLI